MGIFKNPKELVQEEPGRGANHGFTVEIHDGYCAVGDPDYDYNGTDKAGRVSIYKRDLTGFKLLQHLSVPNEHILGSDEHKFGSALCLRDGFLFVAAENSVIVPGTDRSGRVFVYKLYRGEFEFLQVIDPDVAGNGHLFGESLEYSDNMLVIGVSNRNNGEVEVYRMGSSGKFVRMQILQKPINNTGRYGWSCAINNGYIVIGDQNHPGTNDGAVFIYKLERDTFKLCQTFLGPGSSQFGWNVQLNNNILAVSAQNKNNSGGQPAGAIHLYRIDKGEFKEFQVIINPDTSTDRGKLGSHISFSDNYLIAGNSSKKIDGDASAGEVLVYRYSRGEFRFVQQLTSPNSIANGQYGWNTDISDGQIVIAAPNDAIAGDDSPDFPGQVWVYSYGA